MSGADRAHLFVLVAGEASGDLLGAALMRSLRARLPNARFAGIGGPRMQAEGLDTWFEAEELAVMGLAEVLRHLPRLLRIRAETFRRTVALKPSAFIGIDAPDFNLRLERRLRAASVHSVHYVSPSIWAWRRKRAAGIARSCDLLLALFPFEPALYESHGLDARFVGHPLADQYPLVPDREAARRELGVATDGPILTLMPGSRLGEIGRLGRDFIGAARLLSERVPGLRVLAPMASARCREAFAAQLAEVAPGLSIELFDGHARECQIAADAIVLASGTAALEAMLAKRPHVVAYRVSRLTFWIARTFKLIKTPWVSLPNQLAQEMLVPEILQDEVTPAALAERLLPMLTRPTEAEALRDRFEDLHQRLIGGGSEAAAAAIVDSLPC